ncbi:MAG: cupin domain-containing protein [Sneathiella sp.]
MNTLTKNLKMLVLATTVLTASYVGIVNADTGSREIKLLTANFDARQIEQVEVGDFHFKPGQVAPIHTHTAPAVGYVAKGEIIYQVEGEKQKLLREGDAFYEPTGKRILRFDNASATEEAIFLDFNLEQKGEPFIVFEEKPTQAIDRRTLPTIDLKGKTVDQVDIYAQELAGGEVANFKTEVPTLGLVAEGIVELLVKGQKPQRITAGGSFSVPTIGSVATISNSSSEVSAKVITFRLK